MKHVPFIVSGPGIGRNVVKNAFAHHEDIVPTILDLLKIDYDKQNFDGRNLFGRKSFGRKFIFMEENSTMCKRAIRDRRYKYIESFSKEAAVCSTCNEIHGGVVELYDLKNDPEEKTNIVDRNRKKLVEMKMRLNAYLLELRRVNEKRRIRYRMKNISLREK